MTQRTSHREQPPTRSVGVVAVGRPTFDLASAAPQAAAALADLGSIHPNLVGDATIHLTADDVEATVERWPETVDTLVVLLATFTDSTLPAAAAHRLADRPALRVVLWSFPERRTGGRLRWNSLCGAILANYRLRFDSVDVRTVHGPPGTDRSTERLRSALAAAVAESTETNPGVGPGLEPGRDDAELDRIVATMARARVGIVGAPPEGFEPCRVVLDPSPIGAVFDPVDLGLLFDAAAADRPGDDPGTPVAIGTGLDGVIDLQEREPVARERSLRLHGGLRRLAEARRWDAVGVRCWPECFTEWGGAACAPLSLLGEAGLPAACEADGYGALTSLLLQTVAGKPAFLADVVDIDDEDNTVAFWHCGVAPRSFANRDRPISAIDHPNRGVPLALHFGLAPGPVTVARISQSGRRLRLFVGFGQLLDRPPPFRGTSGTAHFETPVDRLVERITGEGLEHHVALVPGDHRQILAGVAGRWQIPLVTLTEAPPQPRGSGAAARSSRSTTSSSSICLKSR